jgi:L-alanine-DL-glutamate epimerase-like enolase superfamily enzyme
MGRAGVRPGTFAATFPPANASNAAAVASTRVANIGASNTAASIGTAVFTLRTGTVNFGASMGVTAGGSDAPPLPTLSPPLAISGVHLTRKQHIIQSDRVAIDQALWDLRGTT